MSERRGESRRGCGIRGTFLMAWALNRTGLGGNAAPRVCVKGQERQLTQPHIDASTSDSMARARSDAPSFPSIGINRVLDIPGIGHLATTTMAPPTTTNGAGSGRCMLTII